MPDAIRPAPIPRVPDGPGASSRPDAAAASERERARLREAAEAFEAILVRSLLEAMRRAQLDEGFFGDGPGASTYEAMFEEELAGLIARHSPLGIADALEARWTGSERGAGAALEALRAERARHAYSAVLDGARFAPFRAPAPPGEAQVPRIGADE